MANALMVYLPSTLAPSRSQCRSSTRDLELAVLARLCVAVEIGRRMRL